MIKRMYPLYAYHRNYIDIGMLRAFGNKQVTQEEYMEEAMRQFLVNIYVSFGNRGYLAFHEMRKP